jgi:hypothetical protein
LKFACVSLAQRVEALLRGESIVSSNCDWKGSAVKTVKTLGSFVVIAILAMAFIGPSLAAAENTALCEVDENPCKSPVSKAHYTGHIEVLTSVMNYDCDALFSGTVFELAAPQAVEGEFSYTNCTASGSTSCTRTEENGPSVLTFLKEGHETAKGTGKSLVHVVCGTAIDCSYTLVGIVGNVRGPLLASENNGEITFAEQTMPKEEGGFLCPKTAKLDGTFVPLSATYISS